VSGIVNADMVGDGCASDYLKNHVLPIKIIAIINKMILYMIL
jgi:hypothetical protein